MSAYDYSLIDAFGLAYLGSQNKILACFPNFNIIIMRNSLMIKRSRYQTESIIDLIMINNMHT
jgi:hypothetical protein